MKVGRLNNDSPVRYKASFESFLAAVEMSKETYHRSFGPKVPQSIVCEPGADVRVLGIGSGSGEADSAILKKILQNHNSVYTRVVEPSEEMTKLYKALVGKDESLSAVKFDWRQQTAEEYFQTTESSKFHLVHAVDSLYYTADLKVTLRDMWKQVADSGYMLVSMESENGDWGKLQLQMWEEFGQGDRLDTSLRMACDVKQWLDSMGISYVTYEEDVNTNVTECFKDDSEAGMLLLDFCTHTPYVSNEPKLRAMALDYIQRNSTIVDKQIMFKSIEEYIVAFKMGT